MQPSNILLVNLHSSLNAGDEALTHEAQHQLWQQFPQASFTLAMNDPESHQGQGHAVGSFTTWVKPLAKESASSSWQWQAFPGFLVQSLLAVAGYRLTGHPWYLLLTSERRTLLEAYFRADMVISAAGNFLYTSGIVGLPFLLSLFAILYAQMAGKPTYTLPQTLGPIRRRHELSLARLVLSKTRLVMIRDPISREVWQAWGVGGPRCVLVPDMAFASHAECDVQQATILLKKFGLHDGDARPWLGVTLIHWGAQDRTFNRQPSYEDAMEAAIRNFLECHNGRVVLFAQVQGPTPHEDDRIPARRLLARLADHRDRVILIDRWVPAPVLRAAYGRMDMFLGTRLHSNIFALTQGVPTVAIGYQYKTRGVMRMLDLDRWVLDIEQVTAQDLTHLLQQAWSEREQIRAHLRQVLPVIGERASGAGALIATDFRDDRDQVSLD